MNNSLNKNETLAFGNVAWPASLALSTVLGSLILACIFPFAAFAALAALTMQPARGLMLVAAVWAINQATGFFVLSFPWDAQAVGHGLAILAATLLGFGAARGISRRLGAGSLLGAGAALLSAFAVYQIILRAYAIVGGGAENFSAEIISAVALNDVLWFAGLCALHFVIAQFNGERALPSAA